jgi:flagellar biogenesis protein FliO
MYGYYRLALKDNKFHYYNRFYLLASLVLSLVIPLLNFHWFTFEKPAAKTTGEEILLMIAEPGVKSQVNNLIYSDWIFMFIIMIGISLLVLLVISIVKIYRIKRNSPVRQYEGIEFIETDVENAPFSFLNNLFWKKGIQLNDENGQKIFKHELTHIKQKHSWDRLFCQIIGSILWINPFNWIIQKELQTIHEFIADEEAVGENNTEAFAKLLLETHYIFSIQYIHLIIHPLSAD